jgi:site-specific DNA-methyltransferase (adenine-specific)
MTITVIHGDCRVALLALAADSVDCVIADPPYGETSLIWDTWPPGWPQAVRRVLKPTGSMWCFGSTRMFMERAAEFAGWKLSHDVVWEKHNGTGLFNDRFRRVHEMVLHFYRSDVPWSDVWKAPQFTNDATARVVRKKGRPAHWIGAVGETVYRSEDGGPRLQRTVLRVRSEHGFAEHPTQKPLGILQPLLAYACPPGGVVLDPFAGSGSTALAAKLADQHAILIEADPEYLELIDRRLRTDCPLFDTPLFEAPDATAGWPHDLFEPGRKP